MNIIKNIIEENHHINMDDIIREGNPTLRGKAEEVPTPLSEEIVTLGNKMMEFLENSQDPIISEEMGLRGGVGLAAPQLDISLRVIALFVPSEDLEDTTPKLKEVMVNPKIIAHSVQEACLKDGEGCLSVDREVEGLVVRHARVTVTYLNLSGEMKKVKLKGYEAIVVQHEIDHLNGVMFFDHINDNDPFRINEGVLVLD
ncbi:MAG: peptide deformylase [Streptococcaceae bacterium]|nr:peptide deformylase [Streptococcaceae bacterium]